MIDFRTDKWLIASPNGVLQDFLSLYYNKPSKYDTKAVLSFDQKGLKIKFKTELYKDEKDKPLHGVIVLLKPDFNDKKYYTVNISAKNSEKSITLETDKGFKRVPLSVKHKTYKDNNYWYAECHIPFYDLNLKNKFTGDWMGINIVEYRAKKQPEITTWYPVRTSYYHDVGTDENGLSKPMTDFRVALDLVNQGRLGRLFFKKIPDLFYTDFDKKSYIPEGLAFCYNNYTSKSIVFDNNFCKNISDIKLAWKDPFGERVKIKNSHLQLTKEQVKVNFIHPKPIVFGAYELEIGLFFENSNQAEFINLSFDKKCLIKAGSILNKKQAANRNLKKRPVKSVPPSERIQKFLDIIPDRVGMCWVGSPTNPHLWPYVLYNWNIENPNEVTLKKDGWAGPAPDEYPEDKKHIVKNDYGEKVCYPYYRDERGFEYFITAHVWFKQREYVLKQVKKVAKTDPLGAARILYKLARAYERYVPVYDHSWRNYPVEKKLGPPFPYTGGVWSWWFYMDLTRISGAAEAFDIVRRTNAFDILSREIGEDVYDKIVEGMFKPSVEYIYTYRVYNSNMDYCIWSGLVSLAKALDEPEYMHEAYRRLSDYMKKTGLFDGFFMEPTISYHIQSTRGVASVIDKMQGWSDPEGYISPNTGKRFDNLNLKNIFPMLKKGQKIPLKLSYPDGKILPLQDTWAFESKDSVSKGMEDDIQKKIPISESELNKSLLMPAAGVLKFVRGEGRKQSQLYMMFSPKYGHTHFDPLNITLYSNEQELIPDIGYNYTKYRYWSMSTLAHNTVVIDQKDSSVKGKAVHGGNIEVFAPIDDIMQVAKAEYKNAYRVEEYSRELWWIGLDEKEKDKGYIIDIFRVIGGNRHEYTLNGDANRDAVFEIDKKLSNYGLHLLPKGTDVVLPEKALDKGSADGHYPAYANMRNVKKALLDDGKYRLTLSTEKEDSKGAGMRITGLLKDGDGEAFIGKSPSLRQTRLFGKAKDTNDEAEKYFMPKFVLRREGTNLNSTFIHVMEPYGPYKEAKVENIEVDGINENKKGNVALKITYKNTTDIILSSPNIKEITLDDIKLKGKMGLIRLKDGKVKKLYLIGGTLLQKGNVKLNSIGPVTGKIIDVISKDTGGDYNAFVTDTNIPDIKDKFCVVRHPNGKTHGYGIKKIIRNNNNSHIIISENPGFEILENGTSKMLFYPMTKWKGEHTFRIENVAVTHINKEL